MFGLVAMMSELIFNSGVPDTFSRTDNQNIWRTNAAICDGDGNLLFYTNGYRIYNKNFQIMQKWEQLEYW